MSHMFNFQSFSVWDYKWEHSLWEHSPLMGSEVWPDPPNFGLAGMQVGKEPLALTSFILTVTLVTSSHISVQDPTQVRWS